MSDSGAHAETTASSPAHVANGINAAGLDWVPVIGVVVVLLIMVFRRWRHLLVLLFCLFFLEIVVSSIYNGLSRPRPFDVPIIGAWDGYSAPSAPVAAVMFFFIGAAYCLVVPGRPRSYAKAGAAAVVALFCLARSRIPAGAGRARRRDRSARRGDPAGGSRPTRDECP